MQEKTNNFDFPFTLHDKKGKIEVEQMEGHLFILSNIRRIYP